MSTDTLLTTWQDAFQNQPVSSIRAVEKQLRGSVLRDREKLRALVGNNYRELLSTAEKIVTLADQTRAAESSISSLSQACKPRNIESQVRSLPATTTIAAQLKFLDSILRCASKTTKAKAMVLASKLLVIARLLMNHLEHVHLASGTIQWLQTRLKNVRQQLIGTIDIILVQAITSSRALAQAIVAYCLVTSSPASDALKHFQEIRAQKISQVLSVDKPGKVARQLMKAKCHYLIGTVVALRSLSGRIVNELLNDVQKIPILEGDDIKSLETLQLDIHQSLLPADIVAFTLYFKRTAPNASELRSNAQAWVDNTFDSIASDIESLVARSGLPVVVQIRHEILDILLPSCFTALLNHSAFSKLRLVFTNRIVQLIESQAKSITKVGGKALDDQVNLSQETLWRNKEVCSEKLGSVNEHVAKLRKHHLGMHENLQTSMRGLQRWASTCDTIKGELQNLDKPRWRDKLEDFDDENEEEADALIAEISKNDPELYRTSFSNALRDACDAFVTLFVASVNKTSADLSRGLDTGNVVTLLRLGREIHVVLNGMLDKYDHAELMAAITTLQHTLARRTSAELFGIVETAEPLGATTFSTEDLPSPLTIQVLRRLASIMLKNGGTDLWTPNVTSETCRLVFERAIAAEYGKHYIRGDFDLSYLNAALGQKDLPASVNANSILGADKEGAAINDASKEATHARAVAYWKRTKALFGIFASA